jgi:hypothetical protein
MRPYTDSEQQFSQSTRRRTEAAREAAKPQPVEEVNEFLAAHEARQQAARAKEQADIASGKLRYV